MADQCLENAKELIRQELQELKSAGSVKRTLYQQDLDSYVEVQQQLTAQWLKNRSRTPLHAHISAVRTSYNLVPSKVLSKQAKLSQCLHLMEVEKRQQTLVKGERHQLVELMEHQVAQQGEIMGRNSLNLMNQLCSLEREIQEIEENMRARGFCVIFQDKEETSEEREETGGVLWWLVKKHVQNEEKARNEEKSTDSWWPVIDKIVTMKDSTETKDATKTLVPDEKSETSSWWPMKKDEKVTDDKSEAMSNDKNETSSWWPMKKDEKVTDDKSEAVSDDKSETSSWWPRKKDEKVIDDKGEAVSDDKIETSSWWPMKKDEKVTDDKSEASSLKSPLSWWPGKSNESSSTERTLPDGSDHSMKSEAPQPAKPVHKTTWRPVMPPETKATCEHSDHSVKSGVSLDDIAEPGSRPWWPVKPSEEMTGSMSDDSSHSVKSDVSYELRPVSRQWCPAKPATLECASPNKRYNLWNISLSSDTSSKPLMVGFVQ
jgi:hypothetical protein